MRDLLAVERSLVWIVVLLCLAMVPAISSATDVASPTTTTWTVATVATYDAVANLASDAVDDASGDLRRAGPRAGATGGSPAPSGVISAPRGVLPTPEVSSTKLQNIVNDLYTGTTNPGHVGTGTTADALRYELRTGNSVFGKSHLQKAEDSLRGLDNWLKANPNAPYHDRLVARSLADDLLDALGRSR